MMVLAMMEGPLRFLLSRFLYVWMDIWRLLVNQKGEPLRLWESVCKLRKKIWASAGCPIHEIWTSAKDFGYP